MAVGMPEPRLGQGEQFLGELHKRGGLCAKSAGGCRNFRCPHREPMPRKVWRSLGAGGLPF